MGAKCASAHMMRSNTKIQTNSANSDLILQAHFVSNCTRYPYRYRHELGILLIGENKLAR